MDMLVHSPRYNTPLSEFGICKPFALDRGTRVLTALRAEVAAQLTAVEPVPITREQALLVHTADYIKSLDNPETWQQIFELKPEEYDPARATRAHNELFDDIAFKSGGTLLAARMALEHGLAANLGGGYHHAFPDRGRGFCALHDVAIAIRVLQKERLVKRVLIVDVDFHQGDGSAVIFENDASVFTFSIHSEEGWPEKKQYSDFDVPVYSHEQRHYNEKLCEGVAQALERFSPDFVFFIAGSDPYELDVLPGTSFIKLTLDELRERDHFVLNTFSRLKIPLAMVFAGGYGPDVWQVHYNAVKRLVELSDIQAIISG